MNIGIIDSRIRTFFKSHSGTSTMLVKTVQGGDTFPTTRPNGSALVLGDFVKPKANATFPFTIDGVTFNSVNDQAVWGGSSWLYNANPFQKTNETPVANKSEESIGGASNYQSDINKENKQKIQGLPQDVQIDGTSVLDTSKVAKIPVASASALGVIKAETDMGIGVYTDDSHKGKAYIVKAPDEDIVAKTNNKKPIVPANLDKAVMEGLGNSSLTWSAEYKAHAKEVLGITDGQYIQVTTMPSAAASLENKIVQFIGNTTGDYTNGYFYKCVEITPSTDPKTYHWVNINVQPSGGSSAEFDDLTIIEDPTTHKRKTAIGGYVRTVPEDAILLVQGNATKTGPYTFTWATPTADIKRLYEEVAVNDIQVSLDGEIDGTVITGTVTGTVSLISSNEVRWVIRDSAESFRLYVVYNFTNETSSIEALTGADATNFSLDCKYIVEDEHEEVEHINPAVIPLSNQFGIDSHDEIYINDLLYIDLSATELTDDEVEFIETHENIIIKGDIDDATIYLKKLKVDGDEYVFVAITENGGVLAVTLNLDTKAITTESTQLSSVSASSTGTSTEQVQYITINGTEYKLAGGGGSVDLDGHTLITDLETGKVTAIYGGGRYVFDTPTIQVLYQESGAYDTSLGVPLMVFPALYSLKEEWKLGNYANYNINVNGTIYSGSNKPIKNISFGTLGTFKAIELDDFIEAGSTSYLTYLPNPTNATVIYTSASISSATMMMINSLSIKYTIYTYYPISKEYMPLSVRYFETNSDDIFEPKVKFGTWQESREIINNLNAPTYTIRDGFIYFNVDSSSEAKEGNTIEINYSVNLTSRGRVRSIAKGALIKIANNQYQASLEYASGDDNVFQMIRVFTTSTPAEIQLQLINEIPTSELEGIDDMTVRQTQWDNIDHPIDSKYINIDGVTIKKNASGKLYADVTGGYAPDYKTIKLNASSQLETEIGGWKEVDTELGTTTYHPIGVNYVPVDTNDFKIVSDLIQVKKRARVSLYDYTLAGTPYTVSQQSWDTNGEYLKAIDLPITNMKTNMIQVDFVCDTNFLNNMAPFLLPQANKLVIYLKTSTTLVNATISKCIYEDGELS